MEDEIQLEFRRFSADKQEQIRQLVAYTALMGLTGKDLVSIGGKLDRIQRRKELEANLAIGLSYDCVIAGANKKDKTKNENRKWYWTDGDGIKWMFNGDYYGVIVRNCNTGRSNQFYCDNLVSAPRVNKRANVMCNVHYGVIKLNF
jgi:hypothetical protein